VYRRWVEEFRRYCAERGLSVASALTYSGAADFVRAYAATRQCDYARALRVARSALRAWAFALSRFGYDVQPWRLAAARRPAPRQLAEFAEFRRRHAGIRAGTVRLEAAVASQFLSFLRSRRKRVAAARLIDVDDFVASLSARMKRKTVAGMCSGLRAFLRFLHATGRMPYDLAASVVAPRVRAADRPPRALPWRDVRRILGAVDVRRPLGRRDLALLLLMATYGMGAGEVLGLRLEDVDWRAGTLRVRRAKTQVVIDLPLLPPVARALSGYLRHGRPTHAVAREIFVTAGMPHAAMRSAGAIGHRLRKYAREAGVTARFLGSHVLRHSHACRQVELGASVKVVGDILGHQHPSSTSAYVRVATQRLRALALPVPR
jgi:integrase/recombinase XerD